MSLRKESSLFTLRATLNAASTLTPGVTSFVTLSRASIPRFWTDPMFSNRV